VLRHAADVAPLPGPRLLGWSARIAGQKVYVLVGGMGKTNAARSLTALLERHPVSGVTGFGVAGAYPGSGLSVGDLALATAEHYGDEGVETPSGWIACDGIGIPLLEIEGRQYFNDFPVDGLRVAAIAEALRNANVVVRLGPFVTVSTCSGTSARAEQIAGRFAPICESMEGAAYAHVAAIYELPFLELRGISNLVEDRDLSRWNLRAAAESAASALVPLVAAVARLSPST
jgi:futalosine hydrolase